MGKFKHTEWRTEKELDAAEYIIEKVDGADHDRGELETISATAGNAGRALGNLVGLLHDKGLLDDDDIVKVVEGIW